MFYIIAAFIAYSITGVYNDKSNTRTKDGETGRNSGRLSIPVIKRESTPGEGRRPFVPGRKPPLSDERRKLLLERRYFNY